MTTILLERSSPFLRTGGGSGLGTVRKGQKSGADIILLQASLVSSLSMPCYIVGACSTLPFLASWAPYILKVLLSLRGVQNGYSWPLFLESISTLSLHLCYCLSPHATPSSFSQALKTLKRVRWQLKSVWTLCVMQISEKMCKVTLKWNLYLFKGGKVF